MKHPIPNEALDDRLAFVGTSGSGKTYAAGTAVERLLESGARVVIVDPLDVWHGLRLTADGKSASPHNVVIFGGAHGDLPLNEHAGKLIGETVATMAESCIVSLGGLPSKAAERRFMLAFLETLYRKTDPKKTGLYHLIFDEADLWAPQRTSEPMLQSRMEEIVRRGRVKGFIPWLITQRPAVISKDVLSQADGLVAFKLTSSQDRNAIGDWVKGQADEGQWKAIYNDLPTMPRGTGVVWLPAHGHLATAQFPAKATFDSSRTPSRGEKRIAVTLKAIDIGALKDKLSGIEEEVKANDPAALKAEIAKMKKDAATLADPKRLAGWIKESPRRPATTAFTAGPERQIAYMIEQAEGHGAPDPHELEQAEQQGYQRGRTDTYPAAFEDGWGKCAESMHAHAYGLMQPGEAHKRLEKIPEVDPPKPAPRAAARPAPRAERPAPAPKPAPVTKHQTGGEHLPPAKQKILDAIAWCESIGQTAPTRVMVAFLAGISSKSSAFQNNLGAMRTAGLIDYPQSGLLCLSDEGRSAAQPPTVALTHEALMEKIGEVLQPAHQRIVSAAAEAYPDQLARTDLAERVGISPTSSAFQNNLGRLRSLGLIDYPTQGFVRAAEVLFP